MIQEYQIRILPEQAASEQSICRYLCKAKGIKPSSLCHVRVLKRSIDARQRTIYVNLTVRAYVDEQPTDSEYVHTHYNNVESCPSAIVVGAGPGGLFAALRLIEQGIRPIVIERGKDVHERRRDIALISRDHKVDSESNYSFGEGGAGAFSDGKLYTRSKKRGNVNKILNVFCQHGASTSILSDAHPHIGTDKLPRVIENMRNTILQCGGEVHFQTRMTALIIHNGRVVGVEAEQSWQNELGNTEKHELTFGGGNNGGELPVILATGHSARDVYRWLNANGVHIEAKDLAVGVRLEHPAHTIDCIQYHNGNGKGKYLPTAEYNVVTQVEGRGVYSFCMCPGGTVVPAASGPQQIVVNGMSASKRNSPWSNSGMVVELHTDDLADETLFSSVDADTINAFLEERGINEHWNPANPLAMMQFQENLERTSWLQGNRRQTAPAQRMSDFVNKRLSFDLPDSSYTPGLISTPMHFWMPQFISNRLRQGFLAFGKSKHGFLTNDALMIGVETRTSSPVRIVRNNETLQHTSVEGLFPCGEGAGYAGGIVSAGVDGERCADMLSEYLGRIGRYARSMALLILMTMMFLPSVSMHAQTYNLTGYPDNALVATIDSVVKKTSRLRPETYAVRIYDTNLKRLVYSHNATKMMRPASNMKLLTATIAMHKYGPDFRFRDSLIVQGEILSDTLRGDVIFKADADPLFDRMDTFASQLRSRGVRVVDGRLIMQLKQNERVTIHSFTNAELPLLFRGEANVRSAMLNSMRKSGIMLMNVPDSVLNNRPYYSKRTCIAADSHTIAQILDPILLHSNNSMTECLAVALENMFSQTRAADSGMNMFDHFIKNELHLNPSDYSINDASGLSHSNRVNTEMLAALLMLDFNNSKTRKLFIEKVLPAAGSTDRRGTLGTRMSTTAASGRIFAKTGTLNGVYTLSGYCQANNGHWFIFSVLTDGNTKTESRAFIDRVCAAMAGRPSSSSSATVITPAPDFISVIKINPAGPTPEEQKPNHTLRGYEFGE